MRWTEIRLDGWVGTEGNRGMNLKAAWHRSKDRKEWRDLVHK